MNRLFYMIILVTCAVACTPKENVDAVKDETMKLHDQVMAEHSKLIANQMKIDTVLQKLPPLDTLGERHALQKLRADLVAAEESMNNWMHNFDSEYTNEVDWEVIHYYKQQRDKIAKIEELYRKEINRSDTYLLKFKK